MDSGFLECENTTGCGRANRDCQTRDDMQVVDERKIDQVVDELGRYKIDIAALQETKWFGEGVYRMGESTVLAAGRLVPRAGVVRQ